MSEKTEVKPVVEGELLIGFGYIYANQGKYDRALEVAREIKLFNANNIQNLGDLNTNSSQISNPKQP